jgi:Mrp family chromosome partitioning ATPase
MPSGPIPPNPAELIDSEKMEYLFNLIRKEFEYVILDTPPSAVVSDTMLLNRYNDISLFIIRQNYTHKNVLNLINQYQSKEVMKALCIVVNDIKVSGYYGYAYRYYYEYGYSYAYNYTRDYYQSSNNKNLKIRFLKRFLR